MDRHSCYRFRNGKTAKNRVIVPPMASQTADEDGFATPETLRHYLKLGHSGAGIIFVEYSFIHQTGKGEKRQLGVQDDSKIEGLSKIARIIHRSGALAGLQLVHVGGKTLNEITGERPMAPSSVVVPVTGWEPDLSRQMSAADIENWKVWFREAAGRAVEAGFDFIEIHAAHGYGINQWLSPLTNRRNDDYGGVIANRARLFLETLELIRSQYPDLLISSRLPAQDNRPGGLSLQDMLWVVRAAEKRGLDLINVSSGIGGWRRPEGKSGEGYLVEDAAKIKSATTLPVVGVGGIEAGLTIDRLIAHRRIDFAAVGRALLKNPSHWNFLNLQSSRTGTVP